MIKILNVVMTMVSYRNSDNDSDVIVVVQSVVEVAIIDIVLLVVHLLLI